MKTSIIKAALILDEKKMIESLEQELESLSRKENIELVILEKGQGRKVFIEKVKKLLVDNKEQKEFVEEDIRGLEPEFDLVIKAGDSNSLGDSMITGLNYAEIVFVKKTAKDFCLDDYKRSIEEFKNRKRNFGK